MYPSRFMPCVECGASVEQSKLQKHRCQTEQLVEYQVFRMHAAIARFEEDLKAYLHSSRGKFEAWLAARQVSGTTPR
jgi:hypothetical protein